MTSEDKDSKEKGFFNWPGRGDKTMWDWLNVLSIFTISIVIVGATIGYGLLQVHLADLQHQNEQTIANQQDARVLDQQRATILQTYIDDIQDLIFNHNLLGSKPTDGVAILARARTLTALRGLDPVRKGTLVEFLYQDQLIGFPYGHGSYGKAIISLIYANLNNADLNGVHLEGADLKGVDLKAASMRGASMNSVNLTGADLSSAHLDGADLQLSILVQADLENVHMENVYLYGASWSDADLKGAHLNNADLDSDIDPMTQEQLDEVFSCSGANVPLHLTCNKTG